MGNSGGKSGLFLMDLFVKTVKKGDGYWANLKRLVLPQVTLFQDRKKNGQLSKDLLYAIPTNVRFDNSCPSGNVSYIK